MLGARVALLDARMAASMSPERYNTSPNSTDTETSDRSAFQCGDQMLTRSLMAALQMRGERRAGIITEGVGECSAGEGRGSVTGPAGVKRLPAGAAGGPAGQPLRAGAATPKMIAAIATKASRIVHQYVAACPAARE